MLKSSPQQSLLRSNLWVVWNEVAKNIKTLLAYPTIIVFWAVFPIFWFIPFILQGQAFVGGLESTNFAQITGSGQYIPFIVIGAILNSYVNTLLYGMGENIRKEAYQGTLDYVLAAPCNKAYVLIGKAISESLSSTIFAFSQLTISVILFGMTITLGVMIPVFFITILLILGLYGMSLIMAAFTLMYKRYPIGSLPTWAQIFGKLIPLTYALIIVRSLMLLGTSLSTVYLEVIALLIIDIALLLAGFYLFSWMEEKTRKSGTISHH
jgi:ABC-2 type transport system permease protein